MLDALTLAAERRLVAEAPDARLVALWVDPPVTPPLPEGRALRGVFALPHARVATLRHWRDTHEWVLEGEDEAWHVVLHEASKWARLIQKSHGGSYAIASRDPDVDPHHQGAALQHIACASCDERVVDWYRAAGWDPPALSDDLLLAPARFAQLEAWIHAARRG